MLSSSPTGNLDGCGTELVGEDQEVLPIGHTDLVENVRHVMPDCTVANRQLIGDIIGVRLRVEQNQLVVVCWRFGSMVIELQGA